uniref:Histone H4 n=1 Tax=Crocodylus porosus TaxID=8502 RepID=A0A7M4EGF4_CROPO
MSEMKFKGSKGLGIGSTKHHRKVLHNIIRGITKLCIFSLIYEETCGALKVLLENVIHNDITYMKHTKQKIITTMGMVYGQGSPLLLVESWDLHVGPGRGEGSWLDHTRFPLVAHECHQLHVGCGKPIL